MQHDLLLFLSPLAGAIVNVTVQVASLRASPRADVWGSVIYGFMAGLAGALVSSTLALRAAALQTPDALALGLVSLGSYLAIAYGYFAFVNLNLTSLRIRLLREMWGADRPVSEEEVLSRYGPGEALDLRLLRLTAKRQLIQRGDRYYVEGFPTLLLVAYLLEALKRVILLRGHTLPPHPDARSRSDVPYGC